MKTLGKIVIWIAIVAIAIQLVPVDKTNQAIDEKENFVSIYKTPANIQSILKNACYDCHSNETVYPNYAKVAPISWTIKDHVNQGRAHLNFSKWGTYTKEIKENALEKSIQTIQNFTMPLPSYIGYHPRANLTKQQREQLITYFQNIKSKKQP